MKGKNPLRKPVQDDGRTLAVKAIFPTLQGEGPYAGYPSVFVRLGGCNLACDFCDTDFENFQDMPIAAILAEIERLDEDRQRLVVITGGEPLRQNIVPLCEHILATSRRIQIETNGTIYRALPKEVAVICSPKMTNGEYHAIRPDLLPSINAFKFILSATRPDYYQVPELGNGKQAIYVQPMDEGDHLKNAANLSYATKLAYEYGYMLSVQLHKIWGIP